jgi:hypothetical protein
MGVSHTILPGRANAYPMTHSRRCCPVRNPIRLPRSLVTFGLALGTGLHLSEIAALNVATLM